ncbi:MAG: ThuA domain-containing protein [Loktanella sp.]|nr:ThuA domain-containing protein [Loktanella sp.]
MKALITWGGWDGHEPDKVAEIFRAMIEAEGGEAQVIDHLKPFDDAEDAGIADFDVETEQYYLHTDPANTVLATTRTDVVTWYHSPNGAVDMPVAWTRHWGLGRVYYNALGHKAEVIAEGPAHEMLRRGILWAADGKARAAGQSPAQWQNAGNHG